MKKALKIREKQKISKKFTVVNQEEQRIKCDEYQGY